jgi:hypothetical protein
MSKMPFKTTPRQVLLLPVYRSVMTQCGVDEETILKAVEIAEFDQGMFDLIELWFLADGIKESNDVLTEIQSSIDDYVELEFTPDGFKA